MPRYAFREVYGYVGTCYWGGDWNPACRRAGRAWGRWGIFRRRVAKMVEIYTFRLLVLVNGDEIRQYRHSSVELVPWAIVCMREVRGRPAAVCPQIRKCVFFRKFCVRGRHSRCQYGIHLICFVHMIGLCMPQLRSERYLDRRPIAFAMRSQNLSGNPCNRLYVRTHTRSIAPNRPRSRPKHRHSASLCRGKPADHR